MTNEGTLVVFVAVKASSAEEAERLIKHPTAILEARVSTDKELILGFLANRNGKNPSWVSFRFKAGEITLI